MDAKRFLALFDAHYGYERKNGHKIPMHDPKAIEVALAFAKDFKPDVVILGGDEIDAGCLSHHNHGKPGRTEGLRIVADAKECRTQFITPLEELGASEYVYILGNHDGGWLQDFEESFPALEGMLNIRSLLSLDARWNVIEQGGHYELGKLLFIHGDQISSGEQAAKQAVITYEKSIRMGHLHTAQMFTKNTPQSNKFAKTGACIPALCRKDLAYSKGKPNRHAQGFCSGWVFKDGTYNDYITIISNGRAIGPNGVLYDARTT